MQGIQRCVIGVLQEKNGKELIIIQEIFPEIRENLNHGIERVCCIPGKSDPE